MSALSGGAGALVSGGGAGSPTFLWELVCDIDFSQEADQALSGGNLTVTNQVDSSAVVLAGQAVAISGGALVLTGPASSNLGIVNASTRTAALVSADITALWPDFDGQPIRWGAEAAAAPTFDAANRAWGVHAENAVGIGGGNLGHGFSAEIRATGAAAATRQTRWQNDGSTNVASLSTTAYASGVVVGVVMDGHGQQALYSTTAADIDDLDTLSPIAALGSPGASSGGSPVQGLTRLGCFAVASTTGSFAVSLTRLVLWARVARVAS